MITILTIAGSDPTGGAGIQSDLRVFESLGGRGVSAITAVTAQTKDKFFTLFPTPADILTLQLSAVSRACELNAIKIGMVATAANVEAITLFLRGTGDIPVVIDPVFNSSTGFPLIEQAALPLFEHHLLPLATVVTPNIMEARTLSKMNISDVETMKTAARIIFDKLMIGRGEGEPRAVIITGGHLEKITTDIVYDGSKFTKISGEKLGVSLHGSGCRYSSALAFHLAKGADFISAARKAKEFVVAEIQQKTQHGDGVS